MDILENHLHMIFFILVFVEVYVFFRLQKFEHDNPKKRDARSPRGFFKDMLFLVWKWNLWGLVKQKENVGMVFSMPESWTQIHLHKLIIEKHGIFVGFPMGPCNKSPVQDAQVFVVASTVYGDGRPRLGCISASASVQMSFLLDYSICKYQYP